MAVSTLFYENDYTLYCKELNTDQINVTGDSEIVEFTNFHYYTGSGGNYVSQRGPGPYYYKVHKNLLVFWGNSSTGNFTFNNTYGNTSMYLGPYNGSTNQPLAFTIPYVLASGDGNFCSVINIENNGVRSLCKIDMNSDVGGVPGNWSIQLYPIGNPYLDNTGNPGTTTGTFSGQMNVCNFFITVPCQPI